MPGESKKDGFSEVAYNQIWREAIEREDKATKNQIKSEYSCNVRVIMKDQITETPTFREDKRKELTEEESAAAVKILEEQGFKTTAVDPSVIAVRPTSNGSYGQFDFYKFDDDRRYLNVKKGCDETKYADNFYTMTGKSAYASNK